MTQLTTSSPQAEEQSLYERIEIKLGVEPVRSDSDLALLVEQRLPIQSVVSLTQQGLTEQEVYALVLPRRTFTHRKTNHQPLTREESDKAVRLARIAALAEVIFGNKEKASRWLRKAKRRFAARTPLAMLTTEAGARLVEEMLYQIDAGMAA
jgi:putative toxin-antitoxin system antitoxin component (TIGR02293 family)